MFEYLMKKFVIIGLELKKFRFWAFGGFVPLPSGIIVLRPKLGGSFSKLYMMISSIKQDEHTAELSIT
jgi:hypothetical protein